MVPTSRTIQSRSTRLRRRYDQSARRASRVGWGAVMSTGVDSSSSGTAVTRYDRAGPGNPPGRRELACRSGDLGEVRFEAVEAAVEAGPGLFRRELLG